MPYVADIRRTHLDKGAAPQSPGELAYLIWKLMMSYLAKRGDFASHNDIHGVLTSLSHELYRRHTGPYEDRAIKRNGDVK